MDESTVHGQRLTTLIARAVTLAPRHWQWLVLLWALILLGLGWVLWAMPSPVSAHPSAQAGEVAVSLSDGKIQMPDTLPAGVTTFVVTNNGGFKHNFKIVGPGVEQVFEQDLLPGATESMQVELVPGAWEVTCPVDNHANRGMRVALTVTEPGAAAPVTATVAITETPPMTVTPDVTATPAVTATQAVTVTPAATATQAVTETPVATPTAEVTAPPSITPTAAAAVLPTATPTATITPTIAPEPAATPAAAPAAPAAPSGTIALVKVADGLADPVSVAAPDDGSGRLFIVERIGRIRIVQDGQLLETPFLDLQQIVKTDFLEQGLLGLAFHPDYANNGRFFVYYSDYLTNGDVYLVEYHVSTDPNVADPESGRVLLTQDKPFVNHNGGGLHFGPDGALYLSIGDGGLAGDPYRNAQNLSTILGKIIRIDVDAPTGPGVRYGIPQDNPFVTGVLDTNGAFASSQDGSYLPAACPEIWAYGLRNPWQFSFDRKTGDLYIADVGQNTYEEVDFQAAGSPGGQNYGWPTMEGNHCYPETANCSPLGVAPVAEYDHGDANCSITGIGVYRGSISTSLDGTYFNADYCSGQVWGLTGAGASTPVYTLLLDTTLQISGAGSDEAGELYVTSCACQYDRSYNALQALGGGVWRLVAADQVPAGAETAPLE